MDEEINEETADKNQYHLDDDDFLSAPGGLLKEESTQDSSEAPREYSPNPTDKNLDISNNNKMVTTNEEHKTNAKLKNPTHISYGLSDDTSDSSDGDDIASDKRKYTHQSQATEEDTDALNKNNKNNQKNHQNNNKNIGKQYSILLNDKSFLNEADANYPTNYIKTSKYTLLTFIPLNLFEQFRRIANIYFLMIIGIQLIPGVSPFPIETSVMPLAFILLVGAIKDGIEDYDRHKQDGITNSMGILRLNINTGQFKKCLSQHLQPSDIVLIKRNEQIPADCIVLSTDHNSGDTTSGVCYINTSSMDGENAPKLRRAVQSTHAIVNHNELCKLKGYIKCPQNTKSLHGFTGALSIKKSSLPSHTMNMNQKGKGNNKSNKTNEKTKLNNRDNNYGSITDEEESDDDDDDTYLAAQVNKTDNNNHHHNHKSGKQRQLELEGNAISGLSDINFIFRGSKLVNTEYVHALVLFVGKETKLMLNRNSVPFKFSKFEKILNTMILSILIFNFILCVAFGIAANSVIEPYPELARDSWFHGFALDTCSWLILTSWMIPFSLYVTLELVKMIQAQWVAWDENMTYNPQTGSSSITPTNGSKSNGELSRPASISVESNTTVTNTNHNNNALPRLERRESVTVDHAWDDEYGGALRHAKTKNSNLNEELGHIDYIFTDKTGTLTQNQMELSKCSVGGIKYESDRPGSTSPVSNDFESFSSLINKICKYQNKKYQLFKLHSKKYVANPNQQNNISSHHISHSSHSNSQRVSQQNSELINMINNDLNEQYGDNNNNNSNLNNKKYDKIRHNNHASRSPLTQLQHDTHFIFNLLLCSSTIPAKVNGGTGGDHSRNNNNNNLNVPSLAQQNLVPSQSNHNDIIATDTGDEIEIKHADTIDTNTNPDENNIEMKSNNNNNNNNNNINTNVNAIEFQSPSPDEVAFAEALYDHGIELCERQADGTVIIGLKHNLKLKFKILATLDFNARRKRMSVIVADEMGEIYLYCKGADSTLFRLCNEQSKSLIHLTKRHVTSFARDGSRTLVIGCKKLSHEEYDEFDRFYREAEVALNNRQELIESAFSYCEHSLYLLGCTAVEDQMQDGVPESIYKLKDSKIKVIMLTGDKQETAVSIGRQSLIIGSNILDSELMFLQARAPTNPKDIDALEKQMRRVDKKLNNFLKIIQERQADLDSSHNHMSSEYDNPIIDKQPALILNGDALEMCLHGAIIDKFLVLFEYCSTIICNRCDPSQKAMIVSMAKNRLDGVALAIGDGANDVSMIQASNVGIGIMGKEGTQASLAADFVIHRFKHIQRLLFVHGRYSFLRTSQVSLISLYKNMAFVLTVCYYGIYSLYTAQSCFDPYLMSGWNLMFVALFPLMVGAFEKDISPETCLNHPKAYYYFKINSFFNIKYFLFWMCTALWQSVVWFSISIMVYNNNFDIWQSTTNDDAKNGGLYVFGTQIFTTNVIVICLKMMMETYHWNWTYYASTAAGFVIYLITLAILSNWLYLDSDMFFVMEFTFNSSMNWLILIAQCVLCLFPGILYNLWKRERFASLATVLYEAQKFGYLTKNGIHRPTNDIIQDYLRR